HTPAQPHVQLPARQPVRGPVRPPSTTPARVVVLQPAPRRAIPQPSSPVQVSVPAASGAVLPAAVAPEVVVDEDDWEWTIALARARAEAEELPTPAVQSPRSSTATLPGQSASSTMTAPTQ